MSHAAPSKARWMTWALAVVMTTIVTIMLLVLAGVFHAKVPTESAVAELRSVDGLKTTAAKIIRKTRFETATGSVKPVHESDVAAKLLARVLEMNVTAGQAVEKDQILARLDNADLQARWKQAEANLANAQAQSEKATTDLERATQLKEKKAISQADFDGITTALKSAEAAVAQADQAVRESQVMLDYATIRAPMTGTVIDKRVEVGDTVAPGQVLLSLFDPTHMQMVASVRESLALKLKPGQHLPTRLDALNLECEATISEVVPEADTTTRSFTVKVTGPCPPGAYSGMFGRLMLPQGDEEILVVPAAAVKRVGQLTMVEVVNDNTLSKRYVRTGRTLDGDIEILAGLQDGDVVVVN
ncbi:MAG: efflux RND transporter periplasmic adaptor subunit [Planctomycetaceae bacterium]